MLELFPTNYVWNLAANLAVVTGGNVGEVDTVCRKRVAETFVELGATGVRT